MNTKYFIALIIAGTVSLSATTVTSVTCSGQTATVNATAHGLVASQGFELTGTSAQFNGAAVTVAANWFTFTVPAGSLCSTYTSGYTSVNPAQQIIELLESQTQARERLRKFPLLVHDRFPNPIPCNLQPNGTTCPVSAWAGANVAQNAAIIAGTTVEMPAS